jgi:hypothetical protein
MESRRSCKNCKEKDDEIRKLEEKNKELEKQLLEERRGIKLVNKHELEEEKYDTNKNQYCMMDCRSKTNVQFFCKTCKMHFCGKCLVIKEIPECRLYSYKLDAYSKSRPRSKSKSKTK